MHYQNCEGDFSLAHRLSEIKSMLNLHQLYHKKGYTSSHGVGGGAGVGAGVVGGTGSQELVWRHSTLAMKKIVNHFHLILSRAIRTALFCS